MIFVAASIVFAWSALIGTAYIVRGRLRLGRRASLTVIAAVYVALGCSALPWLGGTWQRWAGAAGMLVPFAVACCLVVRPLRGRASTD